MLIRKNKKSDCQNGYFHPSDADESLCYKCEIPNCKLCKGSIKSQKCDSCMNNFDESYEDGSITACLPKKNNSTNPEPSPTDYNNSFPTIDYTDLISQTDILYFTQFISHISKRFF